MLEGGTKLMHAVPPESPSHWSKMLPSQHRLYNALGMFSFFLMGNWIRDTMRGFDDKGKEITEAEVLPPFRFLHKVLHHNPQSDMPQDRWRKTMCQIVPAVFGATGAIVGSVYFFRNNTTFDQRAEKLQEHAHYKTGDGLGAMQVNDAATHYTSWPLRMGAGLFATFSAASGLTVLYGLFLNSAFSFAGNRKMFAGFGGPFNAPTGNTYSGFQGPAQVLDKEVMPRLKRDAERWAKMAKADPNFVPPAEELNKYGKLIADGVFGPMFEGLDQQKLRTKAVELVETGWKEQKDSGKDAKTIGENVSNFMRGFFTDPDEKGKLTYRGTENFLKKAHEIFGIPKEILINNYKATNGGLIGQGSEWMLRVFGKDSVLKELTAAYKAKATSVLQGRS
jgi:hypothetical protein